MYVSLDTFQWLDYGQIFRLEKLGVYKPPIVLSACKIFR